MRNYIGPAHPDYPKARQAAEREPTHPHTQALRELLRLHSLIGELWCAADGFGYPCETRRIIIEAGVTDE